MVSWRSAGLSMATKVPPDSRVPKGGDGRRRSCGVAVEGFAGEGGLLQVDHFVQRRRGRRGRGRWQSPCPNRRRQDSPVRAVSSRTRSAWSVSSKPLDGEIEQRHRSDSMGDSFEPCVLRQGDAGFCRHPICRFAPLWGRRPVLDPKPLPPPVCGRPRVRHDHHRPTHVHEILKKHQLTDGMDIVLDWTGRLDLGSTTPQRRQVPRLLYLLRLLATGLQPPGPRGRLRKELLKVPRPTLQTATSTARTWLRSWMRLPPT